MTFPSPGAWRVPTTGWHLDDPVRRAPDSTLALKWLAYPEDPGRSAAVRDLVFGRLGGADVEVHVVELTGQPGHGPPPHGDRGSLPPPLTEAPGA